MICWTSWTVSVTWIIELTPPIGVCGERPFEVRVDWLEVVDPPETAAAAEVVNPVVPTADWAKVVGPPGVMMVPVLLTLPLLVTVTLTAPVGILWGISTFICDRPGITSTAPEKIGVISTLPNRTETSFALLHPVPKSTR